MDTTSKPLKLPQLPKSDPALPVVDAPASEPVDAPASEPVTDSTPSPAVATPRVKRKVYKRSPWRWPNVVFGTFVACGGVALGAYVWLTRLPPPINCQSISRFASESDRLYCTREAVQVGGTNELLKGLKLVEQWDANQPLYAEAQELLNRWSNQVFHLASQQYEQNQLQKAIELASQIPKTSDVYDEAQTAIANWQTEWKTGESLYASVQTALQQQDWNTASDYIFELSKLDSKHWRIEAVNELSARVNAERTAHNLLRRAQTLAKRKSPDQLVEAIALVQQIAPERYVWATAKTELSTWSQALVNMALERWQAGRQQDALALAQHVPADLVDNPAGKDLVLVSQAYDLAAQTESAWEPSLMQLMNLQEAIAAVKAIKPDSPFYNQIQTDMGNWQAQVQDLQQLQFANLTASLGQRWTYELAQAQAQQIQADHPRRLQAQTLAAHWGQEIQRIDDQPVMAFARQLATSGAVPDLQKAIIVATRIPEGRALWADAQTAIGQWQDQIETIEDKPILDKAVALAEGGKLREAIQVARGIGRNRALYDQAQAAIDSWRGKIRDIEIAEDRPILNAAYALAVRERYSLAIEKASQIGEGRALYDEARGAIADWRIRRQALLDQWAAESYDDGYSDDSSDDSYSDGSY